MYSQAKHVQGSHHGIAENNNSVAANDHEQTSRLTTNNATCTRNWQQSTRPDMTD